MAKEQAKINHRRNADEERRMRYLNAPKRLIGIDAQALDAQVAEMRQNRDDHKEADRMESKHTIPINLDDKHNMHTYRQYFNSMLSSVMYTVFDSYRCNLRFLNFNLS